MIGFPVGILVSNAFEWYAHKYVLHGTRTPEGRKSPRPTSMKSHWAHHKLVRTGGFHDEGYLEGYQNWRTKNEVNSLLALCAATSLALPVAPFFTLGTWYSAGNYFYKHRKAHLNPEWAKKHLPWHYDHHMNANQDANWCVTRPWFDYLMGTRVISSAELQESNPLGVALPKAIEAPLNRWVRRVSPRTFAKLEAAGETTADIPAVTDPA